MLTLALNCINNPHSVCVFQNGKTVIQCQICHMNFLTPSTLSAHYETVHRQRQGTFECDVCGKKLCSKSYLRQHLAAAHGVGDAPKFECEVCDRRFSSKQYLRHHITKVHPVNESV